MIQILFAILAGILTIGAPCILPLLPILLGTSVGHTSKTRPLYIVAGFVLVFAILGVFLSFLTTHVGLSANALRDGAIVLLAIFGILMIWPKPFEMLTEHMNGLINKAGQVGTARQDNWGGFILGATLGIIWTPCAGPVLGTILTLVATQNNFGHSLVLLVAYAIGAGIPMLIIAYGSQWVTTKIRSIAQYSIRLRQVFGALIILLAIAMYYQYDIKIQLKLAEYFPTFSIENKLAPMDKPSPVMAGEKITFQNYGPAPEFKDVSHWLNSDPLTMQSLKGKVVLIDFWTYSCINCIRTLPYVTKWFDTYRDQGLVIVGVHTPEFEFEKDTNNVADAIKRFKINYPVAQDNDFGTWNNYGNQYWPAEYLIDKNGDVVYTHFGEGNYDHTENAIRTLLELNTERMDEPGQDLSGVASPEMYFGTKRLEYLSRAQSPSTTGQDYVFPQEIAINKFALAGGWKFSEENIESVKPQAKIRLQFHAAKIHMVTESAPEQILQITVDGKQQPPVRVSGSALYTLFDSLDYNDHVIEITVPAPGLKAFTFTFG